MNNARRISLRHLNSSSQLKQSKYAVLSSVFESLFTSKMCVKIYEQLPSKYNKTIKIFPVLSYSCLPSRQTKHKDTHTSTVIKKKVTDSELVSCKRALTHT